MLVLALVLVLELALVLVLVLSLLLDLVLAVTLAAVLVVADWVCLVKVISFCWGAGVTGLAETFDMGSFRTVSLGFVMPSVCDATEEGDCPPGLVEFAIELCCVGDNGD